MSLEQEQAIDRATQSLKMPGLRKVFREKAREATETGLSPVGYLGECLEAEMANRKENETRRRLQDARFPVLKTLETFDFAALPSLSREKIRDLSEGRVWTQRENVLLVGQVGTGKTHIAVALGLEAIKSGARVRFVTAPALIQELLLAEKETRLSRVLKQWSRFDLVIIDELGYVSLGPGGPLLFQFCSERYERGSLLITSNLEFSRWSEVFGDPSLTTALLDRLTHHSHVLVFQGESYRFRESHNKLGKKMSKTT
jgi:DNA replication protein DnaC